MTRPENERLAVLETQMEGHKHSIEELTKAVKELTDTLNKAKGAWWAFPLGLTAAGTIGAFLSHYLPFLQSRP
jgi:hypothetical protein